jgi:hypothetical protein
MKQPSKTTKGLYLPQQENRAKQPANEIHVTPGHTIRLLQRLMAPAPECFSMQSLYKDNQRKGNQLQ